MWSSPFPYRLVLEGSVNKGQLPQLLAQRGQLAAVQLGAAHDVALDLCGGGLPLRLRSAHAGSVGRASPSHSQRRRSVERISWTWPPPPLVE